MLNQALAVAGRILLEQARQRRGLVFWAVFPALMMGLFGLIYGQTSAMRANLDEVAGGLLIGGALFFSGLGGTLAIVVTERERRTLRRLLVSPLRPSAYFLGVVLALWLVAVVQALIVFGIAAALGSRFQGSVALGVVVLTMSVVTYVGIGFFFAARFARRAEDVPGPLSAFGVPLLVLGGTFFPLELLPESLRRLAVLDPILHMNEAMKGVAGRGLGVADLGPELAALTLFCAVSLWLGVSSWWRFMAEEQRA